MRGPLYKTPTPHCGFTPRTPPSLHPGALVRSRATYPAGIDLLAEVRSGKIDVIVVYKIDRLTRSLAEFAKLVDLFDRHSVSFVSVTQSFR